jgi:hypothetical protein
LLGEARPPGTSSPAANPEVDFAISIPDVDLASKPRRCSSQADLDASYLLILGKRNLTDIAIDGLDETFVLNMGLLNCL